MVLLFPQKPALSFLEMLQSMPFLILLIDTLPKIVLVIGRSVIPLQCVHLRKLWFLGNFTISPLFQLFSAVPASLNASLLNNFENSFGLSSKSVFRSFAGMLSCPAVFPLSLILLCWLECSDLRFSVFLHYFNFMQLYRSGRRLFCLVLCQSVLSRSSVFHIAHLLVFRYYH